MPVLVDDSAKLVMLAYVEALDCVWFTGPGHGSQGCGGGQAPVGIALVLGCGLHLGIMLLMSLVSFGMVMIALLAIGSASVTHLRWADRPTVATEEGRPS